MDLITVIIPVYNIENYIERCVESVMNQSYKNLQIVLVDDGSLDRSGEICDRLALSDDRIVVIHKENGGLSDARNAGIEVAEGSYIGFVDGDDYIEKDMYEILYDAIRKNSADIASCGYVEEWDEQRTIMCCQKTLVGREQAYSLLLSQKLGCSSCTKLFKSQLFTENRYKKGICSEDLELIYRIINHIDKIVCVDKVKYHYVHREGSVSTNLYSSLDAIHIAEQIVQFISDSYPRLMKQAYAYQLMWLVSGIQSIYGASNKEELLEEKRYIYRTIYQNMKHYVLNRYVYFGNYILMWGIICHIYVPTQWVLDKSVKIWHFIKNR